ncbi:hypothetical protein Rumeso_03467 [Rubellimicrobium mesophilum DSM 19309]|uniref:Uncharacterized protein n=1 Tax=Rubellimicrobium mesophilum DSM 19309 TaxID=442562 RepID=A0A017HKV6_9RHOB|nr:hypothetical protein Rumeso_03467 [Rubellimicrobium mesophilum DSM 19309]
MVLDALRRHDCALTVSQAEAIFPALGLGTDQVAPIAQAMVDAGEAVLTEDGVLTLSPAFCAATSADGQIEPDVPAWIEFELGRAEGCRLSLAELARNAEAQGISADRFDAALLDLASRGRLVPEGSDVVHRDCAPTTGGSMARVEAFGMPGYRAVVALHLTGRRCRLAPADRATAVQEMVSEVAAQLDLGESAPPEALGEIQARIEEVLENPGAAYDLDSPTGDLVLKYCSP